MAQRTDIIDDDRTLIQRRGHHRRLARVDGDWQPGQPGPPWSKPRQFISHRQFRRSGPRGFRPYVNEFSTGLVHGVGSGNGGIRRIMAATIGKTVGRNVEDPHHQRQLLIEPGQQRPRTCQPLAPVIRHIGRVHQSLAPGPRQHFGAGKRKGAAGKRQPLPFTQYRAIIAPHHSLMRSSGDRYIFSPCFTLNALYQASMLRTTYGRKWPGVCGSVTSC